MGVLALNGDTLATVCALLAPRDALALALSCKQLFPVALARVSMHVVLSTPDHLRFGLESLATSGRSRHVRMLRIRTPLDACDARTRSTVT